MKQYTRLDAPHPPHHAHSRSSDSHTASHRHHPSRTAPHHLAPPQTTSPYLATLHTASHRPTRAVLAYTASHRHALPHAAQTGAYGLAPSIHSRTASRRLARAPSTSSMREGLPPIGTNHSASHLSNGHQSWYPWARALDMSGGAMRTHNGCDEH
jgi:hypothetical protein